MSSKLLKRIFTFKHVFHGSIYVSIDISPDKIDMKLSALYLVTRASVRVLESRFYWKRISCPHLPMLWYIAWRICKKIILHHKNEFLGPIYVYLDFSHNKINLKWPAWQYLVTTASVRVFKINLKFQTWISWPNLCQYWYNCMYVAGHSRWKRISSPHLPMFWYIAWPICQQIYIKFFIIYHAFKVARARVRWPFDLFSLIS